MRVLVWCGARGIPLRGPSGASEHLREVGRAFVRAGHTVTTATPRDVDERGSWADPVPSVHRAHPWPRGLRTVGARFDGHLAWWATPAVDLIWERFDPTSAAPARWARVPRYVELDAPVARERRWPGLERPAERRRQVRLLRDADRVLAVSRWLHDWAVDAAGVPPERVRWVPNGVPPGPPGDREGTRARLGLRGPVLGFLGSFHRWQGAEWLPALLDALPEFRAIAVGDGPAPPANHPRLLRTGRVRSEAVPGLVAAMDVGLAPYDPAGPPWFCPLKILRYRAEGVPAIATDTGDAAALGATVLPDRDVDRWAAAVRAALERPRTPWIRTWDDVLRDAGISRA